MKSGKFALSELLSNCNNDDDARVLFESLRWPNGPVCPHCDSKKHYKLTPRPTSKKPARQGLYKCQECRKQFTVTVGTIFADSHVPLRKWILAFSLVCASKKGISAHQLHRMLGVTYKTAWFIAHRIRYTMGNGPLSRLLNGTVECDEGFIGGKPRKGVQHPKGHAKTRVMALVERGGEVRPKVLPRVTPRNLQKHVDENIAREATISSDRCGAYHTLFFEFARHDAVKHSAGEYTRRNADGTVSHVNTAESFFSLLKRNFHGAWHHVAEEHLPAYCDEVAFRWNSRTLSDSERTEKALGCVAGKRLIYKSFIAHAQREKSQAIVAPVKAGGRAARSIKYPAPGSWWDTFAAAKNAPF